MMIRSSMKLPAGVKKSKAARGMWITFSLERLLPEMSGEFLSRMSRGESIAVRFIYAVKEGTFYRYSFSDQVQPKESKLNVSMHPTETPSVEANP